MNRTLNRLVALVISVLLAACGGDGSHFGTGSGSNAGDLGSDAGNSVVLISYVSATADQMNLLGQGGVESTVLSFSVTNGDSIALSGETISFELVDAIGGVAITGPTSVQTDASGTAKVTVSTGSVATQVRVRASHSSGASILSDDISIASGYAYANSITIGASPSWGTESTLDMNGIEVKLTVHAGDALGNPVIDGVRFTFLSPEWGTFDTPSCATEMGVCEVSWKSAAYYDKLEGEFARVMAYTNGAEAFVDVNGNNVYDLGEAFTDLGEPYIDTNDSGAWESGEPFVDANGNGVLDGPNGKWDGPCPEGDQYTCGTSSSVPIATSGNLLLCPTGGTDPRCSNNQ